MTSDQSITSLDAAGIRSLYGARKRSGVSARVVATGRAPNTMEILWVAPDGSVQDSWWYDGAAYGHQQIAPAGSASTTSGLTLTSRAPGTMEAFWIGPDGSVQDAWWYQGAGWRRPAAPPPTAASRSSRG